MLTKGTRIIWIMLSFMVSFLLLSCATGLKREHGKQRSISLTETESERRSKVISDIVYQIQIEMDQLSPNFTGRNRIRFSLKQDFDPNSVFLDFRKGKIKRLSVNDKIIAQPKYDGQRIYFSKKDLVVGDNVIDVDFEREFNRDGRGFHRFIDPLDNRVYTYTQFQPYEANSFIPCFDQPNLKARFELSVLAPAEWTVISATRETSVKKQGETQRLWIFAPTPLISSYIFSLHAGPYFQWQQKALGMDLRLFARQSLAKFVNHRDWFDVTIKGLNFFNEYFKYPYPFKKYDQIVVPEFNFGAMENLAAVTFSEYFVHRGYETETDKIWRASVILHEMAHMWFGNLVTLDWWNDLWLNESFATYLSDLALAKISKSDKVWVLANTQKRRAKKLDQSVNTHPVEVQVRDIEEAETNFDPISYTKGASALRQLHFALNDEPFRRGLNLYFRKHEYANAKLHDFMQALSSASQRDLGPWANEWLRTTGVDLVKANVNCAGDAPELTVQYARAPGGSQREHRLKVAVFGPTVPNWRPSQVLDLTIPLKQETFKLKKGTICPRFVLPNWGDHTYIKVELSTSDVERLSRSLHLISDPLARAIIWDALWDMVRDVKIPLITYVEFVKAQIEYESNELILGFIRSTLFGGSPPEAVYPYLDDSEPRLAKAFQNFSVWLEEAAKKKVVNSSLKKDLRLFWWDIYVASIRSSLGLQDLVETLSRGGPIEIDQDRRWSVLYRLCRFNHSAYPKLLDLEKKRDPSQNGVRSSLACQAVVPDVNAKLVLLKEVTSKLTDLSLELQTEILESLLPIEQFERMNKVTDSYYDFISAESDKRDSHFLRTYVFGLSPTRCEPKSIQRLDVYIKSNPKLSPMVLESLKTIREESERCIRVRENAFELKKMPTP